MPWHVVKAESKCTASQPWAVIKDSDGSVAGCHATKADALKQLAALYATENSNEDSSEAVMSQPARPERRYHPGVVTLRAGGGDGKKKMLGGYALKWNTLSRNLGGWVETIAPGACAKSLGDGLDVLCRFQHRDEFLLGRVSAGTHRLAIDDVGLDYEVDLPDTTAGRDVAELAARGDLRHSSFAFYTLADEWEITEQGFPLRRLLVIQLVDTAPVVEPAYLDTTSGLRSLAELRGVDLPEVALLAASNQLADLITSKTTPSRGDDASGQAASHPGVSVLDARRASEVRRAN